MALFDIIFFTFAAIIVISAMGVVFSRKMMYSAFSLLFTFFGVAGLYVTLSADFIALTQIMVYIGGILILIIFGVMLTSKITGVDIKSGALGKAQLTAGALIATTILIVLSVMFANVQWFTAPMPKTETTIDAIGFSLFTEYLLAFFIGAIMLLVAFIGAAKIARRK